MRTETYARVKTQKNKKISVFNWDKKNLDFKSVKLGKKFIVLLLPALTLLLTCVVGPVNTYFRYMIPIVMSLPLIIGLIYYEKKL